MCNSNLISQQAIFNRLVLPAVIIGLLAISDGAYAGELKVCSQATKACPYTDIQMAIDDAQDVDTINIGPGIFVGPLTLGAVQHLTLRGKDPAQTVIQVTEPLPDINNQGEVTCHGNATVTIFDLTITGNVGAFYGVGIHNHCTMDVTNCKIKDVGLAKNLGGGIFNTGNMTLTNVSVQNATAGSGGGIANSGTLTIKNSLIKNNFSLDTGGTAGGGGIINQGMLTMVGSDVVNNESTTVGGGIANYGTMVLKRSTVNHNIIVYATRPNPDGAGIYNAGTLQLENNLIAHNKGLKDYLGGGIFVQVGSVMRSVGKNIFLDNTPNDCANNTGIISCP